MTVVSVPPDRVERWLTNFSDRHGATELTVDEGGLHGNASDGSSFVALPPFDRRYDGSATAAAFVAECGPPQDWGILLVRKGGFAIARLEGHLLGESKTGRRHVQGRTKAGGQSQQRFARRRDNQARAAYEAAADHAFRILSGTACLVVGGDEPAIGTVLRDPRLRSESSNVCERLLTVPDPRRSVLESAIKEACSVRINVNNA